jgi:hypothetical protein
MPAGPKGEKRPRDANQLAKLIDRPGRDREPTPEEQGTGCSGIGAPWWPSVCGASHIVVRAANSPQSTMIFATNSTSPTGAAGAS